MIREKPIIETITGLAWTQTLSNINCIELYKCTVSNATRIIATTDHGIYYSDDNGETFTSSNLTSGTFKSIIAYGSNLLVCNDKLPFSNCSRI